MLVRQISYSMSRLRKTVVMLFVIFLIGVGILFVKDFRWKAGQRRRDAEYSRILADYQKNLHPGMSRTMVADVLRSKNADYSWMGWGGDAVAYVIKIGEDPGNTWFCDHWTVYVGLEFYPSTAQRPEMDPLPTDTLREIHILGQECPSHTRLLDLHQFARGGWLCARSRRTLRIAPEIEDRNLVDARNGAMRGAGFFGEVFAADVFDAVLL